MRLMIWRLWVQTLLGEIFDEIYFVLCNFRSDRNAVSVYHIRMRLRLSFRFGEMDTAGMLSSCVSCCTQLINMPAVSISPNLKLNLNLILTWIRSRNAYLEKLKWPHSSFSATKRPQQIPHLLHPCSHSGYWADSAWCKCSSRVRSSQ